MLSAKNINKLCMSGLYCCKPMLDILPVYKRDNPFWCRNWTFTVKVSKSGKYVMVDTYYGKDCIELTDENFDEFTLIFDLRDVEEYHGSDSSFYDYPDEDRWVVAVDSGRMTMKKRFIKRDSMPEKEKVINRICNEIDVLRDRLENKEAMLQKIMNDEVDLRYV